MAEAAILDCGSGFSKIGYSGDKAPRVVFPTVVGRPKSTARGNDQRTWRGGAVGSAALSKDVMRPIQHGVITNWEAMESIWDYIMLNQLATEVEETPLVVTETPLNSKLNREKIVETMFESYKPPSLYLALKPVLSLYAHGDTDGCVLQSGDDSTSALCVSNGYAVSGSIVKSNLGGRMATQYLKQQLSARVPDMLIPDDKLRELKEKSGILSANIQGEADGTTSFALPDGQRFEVGRERFACAEMNFNPSCVGAQCQGFVECITEAINMCHAPGMKKIMFENIVLAGGNTMFRKTDARVRKTICDLLEGRSFTALVDAPINRKYYSWLGGSVISSLSTFRDMYITEQDYKEHGANIVHQKCPFYADTKN